VSTSARIQTEQPRSRQPLKVAFLGTRGIPANYSGFETFVEQLSIRLATRHWRVVVFNRYPFVSLRDRWWRGIRIVHLPTIQTKSLDTLVHTFLSVLCLPFIRPDVAYFCGVGNAVFCLVPRIFGIPCVINVDGEDWARDKWNGFAVWWLKSSERWAARLANAIIADSRVIAARYKRDHQRDTIYVPYGANIRLQPLGIATLERFGLQPRRYILFCGRMVPENRADLLIRVFKTIKDDSLKLVIVGDAPYSDPLKDELRRLADNRVIFTGYAFGEAYAELSRHCLFFVLTSAVDGTRPVLLDQMGFGNCVLVRDSEANAEVVGDAAMTFDGSREFESLGERLSFLLAEPALIDEFRLKAVERVRARYDWEVVTDQYEDLFDQLCRVR
jgi:glycosyltransferase involved in cell wall biosynthesis